MSLALFSYCCHLSTFRSLSLYYLKILKAHLLSSPITLALIFVTSVSIQMIHPTPWPLTFLTSNPGQLLLLNVHHILSWWCTRLTTSNTSNIFCKTVTLNIPCNTSHLILSDTFMLKVLYFHTEVSVDSIILSLLCILCLLFPTYLPWVQNCHHKILHVYLLFASSIVRTCEKKMLNMLYLIEAYSMFKEWWICH